MLMLQVELCCWATAQLRALRRAPGRASVYVLMRSAVRPGAASGAGAAVETCEASVRGCVTA